MYVNECTFVYVIKYFWFSVVYSKISVSVQSKNSICFSKRYSRHEIVKDCFCPLKCIIIKHDVQSFVYRIFYDRVARKDGNLLIFIQSNVSIPK